MWPNQALQRTGSAVTAPATDHHRLSTHRQERRPLRLSLSLGSLGLMLLVLDRDDWLNIFASVDAAEHNLETIDIEEDEYEFCDDVGQPYVGEVLTPVGTFSAGDFRIIPRGAVDPNLPHSFVSRANGFSPKRTPFKTLEEARSYFSHRAT